MTSDKAPQDHPSRRSLAKVGLWTAPAAAAGLAAPSAEATAASASSLTNTPDADVAALIKSSTSDTRAALDSAYTHVNEVAYDVHRAGHIGRGDDTTTLRLAIINAGDYGYLRLRPGVTYIVSEPLIPRAGQVIECTGARILVKADSKPFAAVFLADTRWAPFTLIDPTIDVNRDNLTDPGEDKHRDVQWCGIYISTYYSEKPQTTYKGWTGTYLIRNPRVVNALGNAIRVNGTPSPLLPTSGADAAEVAASRVIIENLSTDRCRRGLLIDRAGDVVVTNPEINRSDRDGLYQHLTRDMQVIGGTITDSGTTGQETGHGMVDLYSVGTLWQGTVVNGASYNGICAGGGAINTEHTRQYRWIGLQARRAKASGFSIDPTLDFGDNAADLDGQPGHTLSVNAQIVGCSAINNGIHGLYLHHAAHVTVSNLIATSNGLDTPSGAGIAGDAYQCTISSGLISRNTVGLSLQTSPNSRSDGSAAGTHGKYTGYGQWRIGKAVRIQDNVKEDLYIASDGSYEGTTFDLEGTGSPEAKVRATRGSLYRDLATGDLYIKTQFTAGSGSKGKEGWKRLGFAA